MLAIPMKSQDYLSIIFNTIVVEQAVNKAGEARSSRHCLSRVTQDLSAKCRDHSSTQSDASTLEQIIRL